MNFFIGLGLAVLGAILFVLGIFTFNNVGLAVLGFFFGVIGIIALRAGGS